ncbi:MAG: hypothetical protein HKN47_05000 [Pirellulaceae bacterium]|nr:hypothetical protein [Pirellulaceae bacterium]
MKIRHVLRYPVDIFRAKGMLGEKLCMDASYCGRPVALDLYTPDLLFDCGRHLASIAHYASCNKSPIVLRCARILLAAISRKPYGGQMLQMPNVAWVDTDAVLPRTALVLADVPSHQFTRPLWNQQTMEMLIGESIFDHCPVMPYPMHPKVLEFSDAGNLHGCRQNANRAGILFSGTQRAKYARPNMSRQFDVLNRMEILETLRKSFSGRVVDSAANQVGSQVKNEADKPIPIVLPGPDAPRIEVHDWLPTLAEHQFFVCCPGVAQPLCHNLVESMSVGTIPIIEYADRIRPVLQDGVNAICFSGPQGLRDAIARIDAMSAAEIRRMSVAVGEFYDQHLAGETFLSQLCDMSVHGHTREVCMPFHSEDFFAAHQVQELVAA